MKNTIVKRGCWIMVLESLVAPRIGAAREACSPDADLPRLRAGTKVDERRRLLLTMLRAVYVDAKAEKRVIAIRPKPPFRPVFQVTATREGSGVVLFNEPPENSP
jgi:site-specific DNA recombinase